MDWGDAVKACTDLGNGWRLPTKYELNQLHLKKDKIGGFAAGHYWSSTEYGNGSAWAQYFWDYGNESNGGIYVYGNECSVRAVRSF